VAGEEIPRGLELLPWLRAKLPSLSDKKFVAVMESLAVISDFPPVEGIIHESRPRLRRLRPRRPRTLKRPLCLPIEDLLSSEGAAVPRLKLIGRNLVDPLWRHLEMHQRDELAGLRANYRHTPLNRPQQLLDICERLWHVAATVLAVAPIPEIPEEQSILLRDLMAAGAAIAAFKRMIPVKPLTRLGEFETAWIADQLRALTEQGTPRRGYLLAIAARMRSPAELMTWLRESGETVPQVVEQFVVAKLAGEMIDFDRHAAELSPEALAFRAGDLLEGLAKIEQTVGSSSRRQLAEHTQGIEARIKAALKARVIDPASAGVAAALTEAPPRDVLVAAENQALALSTALRAASNVGLGTEATTAVVTIRRACLDRIDEILKRSVGEGLESERAEAAVYQSVRLIELVEGVTAARDILADARRRLGIQPA
jgi:hypothetical protein